MGVGRSENVLCEIYVRDVEPNDLGIWKLKRHLDGPFTCASPNIENLGLLSKERMMHDCWLAIEASHRRQEHFVFQVLSFSLFCICWQQIVLLGVNLMIL